MRFLYTRSAIRKLNHHFLMLKGCADFKQAATRFLERIQGILDDLDERLKQAMAVAPYLRQIRIDHRFDAEFLVVPLQLPHLHASLQ